MASRNEVSIFDQIYLDFVWIFIMVFVISFIILYENAFLHKSRTQTQFYEFLLIKRCYTLNAFSSITFKCKNLLYRDPKIFALRIFGLKCCLHPKIGSLKIRYSGPISSKFPGGGRSPVPYKVHTPRTLPRCPVNAVKDDMFAKTVPVRLHYTVSVEQLVGFRT